MEVTLVQTIAALIPAEHFSTPPSASDGSCAAVLACELVLNISGQGTLQSVGYAPGKQSCYTMCSKLLTSALAGQCTCQTWIHAASHISSARYTPQMSVIPGLGHFRTAY